ncbi:hypothetical protein [Rarobacter incanus]|nr:hypothetical protein [Rarobacter incanus]
MSDMLDGTYASLSDRLEPSGYTPTSLTGAYEGMFVRDSAIQANAMLAAGQTESARSILQYLIGYGTEKELARPPRYLPAEAYQAKAALPLSAGNPAAPIASYSDLASSTALLKINGPNHGAAMAFVADGSAVTKVELGLKALSNAAGTTTVTIRAAANWDAPVLASATRPSADSYSADGTPSWQTFAFDSPATLPAGSTYYVLVQSSAEPDTVMQLWGAQQGGSGVQRTYNYDGGWGSGPIPGRGLFKVYTVHGLPVAEGQTQVDAAKALFQIQGETHQAAQSFRLGDNSLSNVWLPLTSAAPNGQVTVSIQTDYTNAGTTVAIGTADLAHARTSRTWVNVPLVVNQGAALTVGATYWIVPRATVPDASKQVVWYGAASVASAVGAGWNYDTTAYGGWHAESHSLGFALNASSVPTSLPAFTAPATDLVGSAGSAASVEGTISASGSISGLDLYLGAAAGASGEVQVAVTDSVGRTSAASIPAAELSAAGSWHRFRFPTVGRGGNGTLKISVSAPSSAADSVRVYGVGSQMGYQALSLVYSGEMMTDQPDGNYMLIDAWARYVQNNPQDSQFFADTYPTIASWADYYLTAGYLDSDLQLMFNKDFEHSRRHYHIPTFDLMTNVFASQALHELSKLAADLPGQSTRAENWAQKSAWLEQGIKQNLITQVTVGGQRKTIYGELIWDAGKDYSERTLIPGYSWVNFAPVAADWYALDWSIMADTYDAYLEHGSIEWTNTTDSQVDRMLLMDTEENTWEPADPPAVWYYERYAVIGKGVGWELMTARKLAREDRLATIAHFLDVHTPGDVLGEFYYAQGPSDVGNQEQGSWWVLGMLAAYPRTVAGAVPVVSGRAQVGSTLVAEPGTWTAGAALTYEWQADGDAIAGATTDSLVLTSAQLGKTITVVVTGSKSGYEPARLTSIPTAAVTAAPGGGDDNPPAGGNDDDHPAVKIAGTVPAISGKAQVGRPLSAKAGSWTPTGVQLSYQWLANGVPVPGANAATFVPRAAHVGKAVSVRVSGTKAGLVTVVRTSAATAKVLRGELVSQKVKVRGSARVGKKIKAVSKAWGPAPVKLSYRWYANGKRIKGATKKTLRVQAKQRGKKIQVRVTGKKSGYTTKVVKSAAKRVKR